MVSVQPVTIPYKDTTLASWFFLPQNLSEKTPAVIFYHGMVSQSQPRTLQRAKKLAHEGIIGFCFDFRGCGKSGGKLGKLSLADWLEDAQHAYDFFVQNPFVDPTRIGLSGKSFGGYMAALMSNERPVKSMVLQAPAVYDDHWFSKTYDWKKEDFMAQRKDYRQSHEALKNKALKAISHFCHPLLVIGSENDDICPAHVVEGYYTHAGSHKKQLHWIKGADHQLSKDSWNNEYTNRMINWFRQTLP